MRRTKRQQATADDQRNMARLREVQEWLRGLNLTLWHVVDVVSVNGFIIGVRMTFQPTGETIIAQSGEDVAKVEQEYQEAGELRDHLIDSGDIPDDAPVTCHRCGAVVDGDALAVQTAADGPKLGQWYCRAHLVAGTERLLAAIRAQREQREGGA